MRPSPAAAADEPQIWADARDRSATVDHYIRASLAPSTQRAYTAATRLYDEWARFFGARPEDVATVKSAEEFVGALGDLGQLTPDTIQGYVAALAFEHVSKSTRPENPWRTTRIGRILLGIRAEYDRTGRAARNAARARERQSDPFTASDWRTLATAEVSRDEWERMALSAAALGCALGLRPGELCGGPKEYRERVIACKQLTFYADREGTRVLQPSALAAAAAPDNLELRLTATKTAPAGDVYYTRSADLVRAIWAWACHRTSHRTHGPDAPLFSTEGGRLIRVGGLTSWLEAQLAQHNINKHLTGKCFRRGAASALAAALAPEEDLQAIGHWRTPGMHRRYTDEAAKRDRALHATERL